MFVSSWSKQTLKTAFIIQKFSAKIGWEVDRLQQRIFSCKRGTAGLVLQLTVYFQVKIARENRLKPLRMHEIFSPLSPTLLHAFLIIYSLFKKKKSDEWLPTCGLLTSSFFGLSPFCCWLFGGRHESANTALFLDSNCLERRIILIHLKHKVITCFEV